ncbi:MAG: caspase domain-containing protein [Kofleriaceae bacterium]
MTRLLLSLGVIAALATSARADDAPAVATYAIVVGSNAGGPGQATLRYAEEDARRMGAFLSEMGGYPASSIDVIVAPTPDVVRAHVDELQRKIQADLAAGKKTRVLFYYSGHARATALDLGNAQLPLAELRTRLFSVPAHLTVVVLDACQSGAFSRVKGATPAADFSFNSKNQLDASGVAVLASSSGSELSQESESLRGSYFTHHLLVGMRGAGDTNRDGQVSIDEAYRYAYHQTLLATAETAVGGQHVSLEVDLKGHGEVPMSFPRAATSAIVLPATLEGKTLVEDKRAKAVVAETYKAKGAAVRIAVAPGEYQVLVRRGSQLSRCQITAGTGGSEIDLSRCSTEAVSLGTTKGGGFARPWRVDLGFIAGEERRDAFFETLENFGWSEDSGNSGGAQLAVTRQYHEKLRLGGRATYTDAPGWTREDELTRQTFRWSAVSLLAHALAQHRFFDGGRLGIYGTLGLGLSIARSTFVDPMEKTTHETFVGPALSTGAGLSLDSHFGLGFTLGYQFDYQRAVNNLIGDTHASGGHRIALGLAWSL